MSVKELALYLHVQIPHITTIAAHCMRVHAQLTHMRTIPGV